MTSYVYAYVPNPVVKLLKSSWWNSTISSSPFPFLPLPSPPYPFLLLLPFAPLPSPPPLSPLRNMLP